MPIRSAFVGCIAVALWGGSARSAPTLADRPVPGARQADVHNPFSSRYTDLMPGGFARRHPGSAVGGGFPTSRSFFYTTGGFFPFDPYFGGYPLGPGYDPYGPPYFVPPYYGGILPPLFIPGEEIYGPRAVRRFFGFDQPQLPPLQGAPQVPPGAGGGGFGVLAPDNDPAPPRGKPRASNADARARATRFVALGDMHFARQAYSDAYQRYRLAAQSASDLGEAYFRQGFALVAMGRYESAAKAFKRGLTLTPDWPAAGFRLDTLYGDNQAAKGVHLEALTRETEKAPHADLMFLLGVFLYCDGHPDRARPFFARASDLAGPENAHLAGFLKQFQPAAAPNPPPRPAAPPAERPEGVDL